MSLKENLEKIKEQIGNYMVKIIAVTKYATQEQIYEAYRLGILDFGESYLQDALVKLSQKYQDKNFKDSVKWHFIGRLQKNKIKKVVGTFFLIHSVDSFELAENISKEAAKKNLIQNILLQVNISSELTKGGFKPVELKNNFEGLKKLKNINIQGFMTIAPKTEDKEIIKNHFSGLSMLKQELNNKYNAPLKELSMGMTDDYKIALGCGATMIRIGRGLFKNNVE